MRSVTLSIQLARRCASRRIINPRRRFLGYDAHAKAEARIEEGLKNTELTGLEAIQALPASLRYRNYATASCLFAFVGWVFWYSMNAVGQSAGEDPLANLQREAETARAVKAKQAMEEQAGKELAQMDIGVDASAGLENEDYVLAVAAPDDIATEEEERNKAALKGKAEGKRSMLNRIVFFWK